MPDVRHGCAAQSSARLASRPHQASARARISPPLSLTVACPPRRPAISRVPTRRTATPHTAHPSRLSRALAHSHPGSFSPSWPHPSHVQHRRSADLKRRREPRNDQLQSTSALCFLTTNISAPAKPPGSIPRASTVTVVLDPPRFHSAVPNPACSGLASLRAARR